MKKSLKKGFTLIELLVVIAIIGILAAVVLASLNQARDKGADAAVKSNSNGTRAQAELIYDGAYSYDAVCTNAQVTSAVTAMDNANGAGKVAGCADDADEWVVYGQLKTSTDYWCVDNDGRAGTTTKTTYITDGNIDCTTVATD